MRTTLYVRNGFTLIELMVAVAIIGLLLAIVIPNYQESVRRGFRSDGMDALTAAAQKMEVVRARTGSYTADLAAANIATTSTENLYSNLRVLNSDSDCPIASCYVLQIDGQNGQELGNITAYRLYSTGRKQQYNGNDWEEGWQ
jgi:prepilin-type N-terminal cleavage/methylation domain-containing protein